MLAALLAVVLTQFGFLGHDAAHRQIFASHRWNEWAARVMSGLFTGLSYGWWMTSTTDTTPTRTRNAPTRTLIRCDRVHARRRSEPARTGTPDPRTGLLLLPLLLLEGLALHVASIQTILRREPLRHRWCEAAFVVAKSAATSPCCSWCCPGQGLPSSASRWACSACCWEEPSLQTTPACRSFLPP